MDFLIDDYRGGEKNRVQSNPRKTCVNVNECIIPLKKQKFGTWRNAGDGNRNWILFRSKKMNWMKKERPFFYEKLMIWFDRKKKEREIMEGMMERKERNQESFLVTKEMGNEWRILEFFKVKYKGAPTCSYNNICLSRIWKALFPFPCLFPSSFFWLVSTCMFILLRR